MRSQIFDEVQFKTKQIQQKDLTKRMFHVQDVLEETENGTVQFSTQIHVPCTLYEEPKQFNNQQTSRIVEQARHNTEKCQTLRTNLFKLLKLLRTSTSMMRVIYRVLPPCLLPVLLLVLLSLKAIRTRLKLTLQCSTMLLHWSSIFKTR